METTTATTKIEGHGVATLKKATEQALLKMSRLDPDRHKASWTDQAVKTLEAQLNPEEFDKMGICDRRRLRRMLNSLDDGLTLDKANEALRLLARTKAMDTRVQITEPKHEAIQAKRKKMVAAKKAYEAALVEYKAEKGDYYKK